MKNKIKNERIGILAIIAVVILTILALFYFFEHQHLGPPPLPNVEAPVESPAPPPE